MCWPKIEEGTFEQTVYYDIDVSSIPQPTATADGELEWAEFHLGFNHWNDDTGRLYFTISADEPMSKVTGNAYCSGALSSDSFSGAKEAGVSCCSVHPMLPFSNKFSSYQQLEHAFFTVEGHPHAVQVITDLLTSYGNEVCRIDAAAKPEYHAAASILSNQVIAVLDTGYRLLEDCGFSREKAVAATAALVRQNIENVLSQGCVHALTGPIERGDVATVEKHLHCLNTEDAALYRMLGTRLLAIAEGKNPTQNYENMRHVLLADEQKKGNGGSHK